MGSGKSSMGRMLAELAGLPFVDMDEVVEKVAGMGISAIFNTMGEAHFRDIEHEVLLNLIEGEPAVIATGGGVPCFQDHMELMKTAGTVVYMRATPDELFEWLEEFKGDRPLLQGLHGNALKEWITAELSLREPYYLQADLSIEAYHTSPKELFQLISDN